MQDVEFDADLDLLRRKFAKVVQQRNTLREQIAIQSKPAAEGELAEILRAAFRGDAGWRERARQALGDYQLITCETCGTQFPSGGKRKKNCGGC